MKTPNVVTTIVDRERNITYDVFAYRTLTHDELVFAVRHFYAQKKRPKVKPGQRIIIYSVIGFDGR
jgi:hypothetical protein